MDLEQCLAILSGRGVCGSHEHHQPTSSASSADAAEPLGQVIDLLPPAPPSPNSTSTSTSTSNDKEDDAAAALSIEARAQASVANLQEGLSGFDVHGLVGAFRQAQEERAQAYQRFDEGLNKVLASRAFVEYDGWCAEATAGFAALSNLVNAVAHSLGTAPHDRKVVAGLLRRVQAEEKEKLSLTAALHLEKFRLATLMGTTPLGVGGCGGGGGGGAGEKEKEDGREERLLREGVKTLEGRIGEVKVRINEIMEELRYEMEEE